MIALILIAPYMPVALTRCHCVATKKPSSKDRRGSSLRSIIPPLIFQTICL